MKTKKQIAEKLREQKRYFNNASKYIRHYDLGFMQALEWVLE